MKASEFKKLIREEVRKVLNEVSKPKYMDFGPFKKVEYAGPGRKDGEMIIRLIVSDKNLANKMSQYLTSNGIENKVLKSKETNDSLVDVSTNYLSKLETLK